jgi:signal transduction histidine kinase
MEISDLKPPRTAPPLKIVLDDIVDDMFHDIQNGIHRIGMELELTSMGLGSNVDPAKTTELTKSLENSVRDLRGYISSLQSPSASCDLATVLQDVVENLQMDGCNAALRIRYRPSQSLPVVPLHRKLLNRVLERILDFCADLLRQGGEIRIAAEVREDRGRAWGEVVLTLLASTPLDIDVEKRLIGHAATQTPSERGAKRALEVFRRHRGEFMFRQSGDCHCEIILRISATPG